MNSLFTSYARRYYDFYSLVQCQIYHIYRSNLVYFKRHIYQCRWLFLWSRVNLNLKVISQWVTDRLYKTLYRQRYISKQNLHTRVHVYYMHVYCELQFYFRSGNHMHTNFGLYRILRIRFAWTHVKNIFCIYKFETAGKFLKWVFSGPDPGNIAV